MSGANSDTVRLNKPSQPASAPPLLQVDPKTDLAGYTYETNQGRYATFFWQNYCQCRSVDGDEDDNDDAEPESFRTLNSGPAGTTKVDLPVCIYSSTFHKRQKAGQVWKLSGRNTLVASNAKTQTPLAAVSWSNGLKAALYYLDVRNNICERLTTDGGNTWSFGSLTDLSVPTRKNSSLAAAVSWSALEAFEIQVYFQDDHNRIRNLQYSGKDKRWFEECPTVMDSLKRISGSSIVTSYDHFFLDKAMVKKVVFTLSPARDVCEFAYENKRWSNYDKTLTQQFDRNTRLGLCVDPFPCTYLVFAHDGSKVLERAWVRSQVRWGDETNLPISTGTSKILQNFIALHWPVDPDCTGSEIHLFSIDEEGTLWDYLVGPATGMGITLVSADNVAAIV